MRRHLSSIIMGIVVVAGFAVAAIEPRLDAQPLGQGGPPPSFLGSGVDVTQSGIVRIDKWICYEAGLPGQAAQQKPCPTRVEFGVDVPETTLVCRASATGQTCRTIAQLFPEK